MIDKKMIADLQLGGGQFVKPCYGSLSIKHLSNILFFFLVLLSSFLLF